MADIVEIDKLNDIDIVDKTNQFLFKFLGIKLYFYTLDDDNYIKNISNSDNLCKSIYSSEKKEKCISKFKKDLKKALNKQKPIIHQCFLDSVRLIVPLLVKREVYGVAISSQIKTKDKTTLDDFSKDKANAEKITKLWERTPYLNKKELESLVDYLVSLAEFVFLTKFEELVFFSSKKAYSYLKESLEKAVSYIKNNYSRPNLSLSEVAEAVNLSPYYFSHQFKKKLDTTFIEYLTKERIKASTELLKDFRLSIAQVSFAVGYQDSNYFSKVFKKYMNLSPVDYREEIIGQKSSQKMKNV
jgi:YesN/AraC family two-component response regulator